MCLRFFIDRYLHERPIGFLRNSLSFTAVGRMVVVVVFGCRYTIAKTDIIARSDFLPTSEMSEMMCLQFCIVQ